MSDYRDQPPAQGGWPTQPSASGAGQGAYGQDGYGQDGYGQPGPGQPGYRQSGYGQQGPGPTPPRRRRRRRRGTGLIITLVVILVLLFVGDQVAKAVAQNEIAQKIESSGLNTKPSVKIEGWPFLTQIASRDLKAIDISAHNVTAGGSMVPVCCAARATGVHLNSSFNGATIDQINGSATITFAAIANVIPIPGLTLSPDPAKGPDAVQLNTDVGGATGTIKQTSSNVITLQLGSLTGLAGLLSGITGSNVAQSYTIDIPKLPAGLVVRSVDVTSQGIVATASASNTTLTQ